jgi:hypothetical protein
VLLLLLQLLFTHSSAPASGQPYPTTTKNSITAQNNYKQHFGSLGLAPHQRDFLWPQHNTPYHTRSACKHLHTHLMSGSPSGPSCRQWLASAAAVAAWHTTTTLLPPLWSTASSSLFQAAAAGRQCSSSSNSWKLASAAWRERSKLPAGHLTHTLAQRQLQHQESRSRHCLTCRSINQSINNTCFSKRGQPKKRSTLEPPVVSTQPAGQKADKHRPDTALPVLHRNLLEMA